jgi:hypothetical protein
MSNVVHPRIPSLSKTRPHSILRGIIALAFIILLMLVAWLFSHIDSDRA